MSVRALIMALVRRTPPGRRYKVETFEGKYEFRRFCPFWDDEWTSGERRFSRPPWWRPFNVLLHHWRPDKDAREPFHDHPRWSVTVVLKGRITEETPWSSRSLTPGCIVIRSRKAIHRFFVPEGFSGRTWTLFIVGRRDHRQTTFSVIPR